MPLRIELRGLPPYVAGANSRAHWTVKRRAAIAWGTEAFYELIRARNESGNASAWRNLERIRVSVTFVVPNNNVRHDRDNLIFANKAAFDAIVRAGIVIDDDLDNIVLAIDAYRSPSGPKTIMEIEPW